MATILQRLRGSRRVLSSMAFMRAAAPFRSLDSMKPTKVVPLFPTSEVYFPGEKTMLLVMKPRDKLMMESLDSAKPVIGLVRQPSTESVDQLTTDWHSSTIGSLGEVVSYHESLEMVEIRFTERFTVHDAERSYMGYWRGTTQRLTDAPTSRTEIQQADVLSRTVSALLNEYAKHAIGHDTKTFNRFQMRHAAMASKGLVPFSFWVALQVKAALQRTEANADTCQALLETTSIISRLETESKLLSTIINDELKEKETHALFEELLGEPLEASNELEVLRPR
eukprot:m.255791 g.255791  ORF g.255791 m.255791 type:complete len:281 (-) comp20214_c0_seq1:216-1058(-)